MAERRPKTIMVAAGLAVAAGVAWLISQAGAVPPPGKANLKVEAYGNGSAINIPVTVDGRSLTTPQTLQLDLGSYTLSAPEQVTDGVNVYNYSRFEEVAM
jgi:hypothetical protein